MERERHIDNGEAMRHNEQVKQLCADEYMISVKRTQLWVQFKVRFDMEGDQ